MRACVSAIALILIGCGVHDAAALTGSYEAAYNFGTARLVLGGDGTFAEFMRLTGQDSKQVATGRWRYDAGASRITLSNFSEIAYPDGLPIPDDLLMNGPTTVPVEWNTTPLTIRLGAGDGTPFVRER
jgi:hypothetical protein